MTATRKPRFTLDIEAPANGKVGKATIVVRDSAGKTIHSDRANLTDDGERRKLVKRMAEKLEVDEEELLKQLEDAWNETLDQRRRHQEQVAAGSPEAATLGTFQLLDTAPLTISRPLALVGGCAYAAAWIPVQHSINQSVSSKGVVVKHDPPLVTVSDVLLIVAGDGTLYADGSAPDARPLKDLGLLVHLPAPPPPGRGWSGAGVKRFLAGERPSPAEVFGRIVLVVDRFLDFSRSLAPHCTLRDCLPVFAH